MRTTKAQISLRIREVWSEPLLFAAWIVSISEIPSLYLASLAAQAGLCLTWSQTRRQVFMWRGSYYLVHVYSVGDAGFLVGWLCWGLTSQSTIFQSYRDGAIASWVINQYFRGVKCLAQGHNTAAVGLEPRTSRSGVRHSTTEPPRSPGDAGDTI